MSVFVPVHVVVLALGLGLVFALLLVLLLVLVLVEGVNDLGAWGFSVWGSCWVLFCCRCACARLLVEQLIHV